MIRYSKGFHRQVKSIRSRGTFLVKRLWGLLCGYPVYRPPVDHTVYEVDNKILGSTFLEKSKVEHYVSLNKSILDKGALIEFEHALALIGHVDSQTDYIDFRGSINQKMNLFFDNFVLGRHRLCGSSKGAVESAISLSRKYGHDLPTSACEVLPWGLLKRRDKIANSGNKLRVFHYGGFYPLSKGTQDVLALSRRFPSVDFEISIDVTHPLLSDVGLPNVHLHPVHSKKAYDAALKRSHILLYPIYADGWGVALEALSLAMPIIAYDSYDKSEVLMDGQTGYLVSIPKHLSFYDGFFAGPYRNWSEYNEYVASYDNSNQIDNLSVALETYCRHPEILLEHSRAASSFFDSRYAAGPRIKRIQEIYGEILSAVGD